MRQGTWNVVAPRVLVIGVGNPDRGDDGIGPWVAKRIAQAGRHGATAETLQRTDGTALLSAWQGAERVFIVDAVAAPLPMGTIVRLTASQLLRRGGHRDLSTHGIGIEEAVRIGAVLGLLPAHLTMYGIVGSCFAPGSAITAEVEAAGRRVIARIRRSIRRHELPHA